MVEILLKKYPQYRFFYNGDDDCSSLFIKHKNFENRRKVIRRYRFLDKCVNALTVGKKPLFFSNKAIAREIRKCEAGVLIGGSMYMQLRPKHGIRQQLKWAEDTFGDLPRTIIGVNFGPYQDEEFRTLFTEYFRKSQSVTFRDKTSYGLFSQLPNAYYAPDVVFNLDASEYMEENSDNTVLISVINMSYRPAVAQWEAVYDKYIVECCNATIRLGKTPVLVSFCKQEEDELAIDRIMDMLPKETCNETKKVFYDGNLDDILRLFARVDYVIATRFHAMILAMCFNKPFFSISYSDKVRWVLEDLNCSAWCSLEQLAQLDPQQMFKQYANPIDISACRLAAQRQFEQFERYMDYGAGK